MGRISSSNLKEVAIEDENEQKLCIDINWLVKLEGKLTDLWAKSHERIKQPAFKEVLKKKNENIKIYDK